MSFNRGDKVEIIDDTIKGVVIQAKGDTLLIETVDGFTMEVTVDEVVKMDEELHISNAEVAKIRSVKESGIKKRKVSPKQEKVVPPMEVDLHIHQLTPSSKNMTNYDMLTLQLETAQRQLEFAIGNRIQRVVFIHGVGEGVLRTELEYLFGRYDHITYYDADYQKYGLGATEVYIFQKSV